MKNSDIDALVKQVDAVRLKSTVKKLASWPNRNTNNPTLTEAAEWIASQYAAIPGLKVEIMRYKVEKSPRIPEAKEVVQVIATLPGKNSNRVMVGGHMDTVNMTPGATLDSAAPGANDDASGVALSLEMARILSTQKWNQTLCFIAFSGEEQGLLGSTALAKRAKAESWQIDAVLSNDMVSNSSNKLGQKDNKQVRVFSEESQAHHGRELARWIEWIQRSSGSKFGVKLVLRPDRFGRGGDHTPFNREGFTAVRFVEVHEEYSRQHTPDDLPEFVDEKYLAEVAKVNLRAMANLANAAPSPSSVKVSPKQGYDSQLSWEGDASAEYVVYWRDTRSAIWEHSKVVKGLTVTINEAQKDDVFFAVGAVGGIPVLAR